MKKREWLWFSITLCYSYLFYQQSAGINFLIFALLLVVATLILQPQLLRQHSALGLIIGCLLSAIALVWQHTWAALWIHVLSLMCLSGLTLKPQISLFTAWSNSFYSLLAAPAGKIFIKVIDRGEPTHSTSTITSGRLLSWIVPILIVAIFFLLYVNANPVFGEWIAYLRLDFISPGWILFTLFGAYLLCAFFYPVGIQSLINRDLHAPDRLIRQKKRSRTSFNIIGLQYEYRTGCILFIMLNGLLLFFHIVDIATFITGKLPAGVSYSAYVHQGVYTLVTSIVLAIAIVLYFFRGTLNFLKNNHLLKYVTYLWIIQNIVLLLTTLYKNNLYVEAYGLTYRRIGVYLYLLLTLTGLITTYFKIYSVKSNWFLFRKNAWVCYVIFIAFSFFDWSRIITQYNLHHLPPHQVDYQYLIQLPHNNLDQLYITMRQSGDGLREDQKAQIQRKVNHFHKGITQKDWQSWNYAEWTIHQRLQSLQAY